MEGFFKTFLGTQASTKRGGFGSWTPKFFFEIPMGAKTVVGFQKNEGPKKVFNKRLVWGWEKGG